MRTPPGGLPADGGADRPSAVRLAILFLTVFVDLVGFGIVLPLLPFYADRFGASGTEIGVLVFSYSAAQLLLAPLWGRLSDRYGRRPILIIGLLGSAASYVVFAFAQSAGVLLLSRIMAGVGGANIPVAQAYIADVTTPAQRAGGMGLIGAAFGLGFIFGPAIGGLLAPVAPEAPGLAAAGLCALNAVLALFLLPESLSAREREEHRRQRRIQPLRPRLQGLKAVLANRPFMRVLALSFLFTAAFSAMHPVFPLFASDRLGLDERGVGWLFTYMGVVSAIMQGGVVRWLAPRIGERGLIRLAAPPFVAGLILIAAAQSIPVLLAALLLLGVGFGGTLPSLISLLSRSAPAEIQGGYLGVGQSVGALARIAGPFMGGVTWDLLGPSSPFLAGAVLAAVAGLWVFVGPNGAALEDAPDPAGRGSLEPDPSITHSGMVRDRSP